MNKFHFLLGISVCFATFAVPFQLYAAYRFEDFRATSPIHVYRSSGAHPLGLSPSDVRAIYHLPERGGKGTIAIVGAYHDTSIERDLATFDQQFALSDCTIKNGCLAVHKMSAKMVANSGWTLEDTLDVEWAHAIAPDAKIVLVEAATPSGANLIKAVDYAAQLPDVRAISRSRSMDIS
jgi:subtilase family serine protease